MLTGKYQQKVGVPGVIIMKNHRDKGLSLDEKTFAEIAKEVGYKTGVLENGILDTIQNSVLLNKVLMSLSDLFQEMLIIIPIWTKKDLRIGGKVTLFPETGYSTDLISKHSIDFIKRNRNENFLLYVAHESPHYPYQGRSSKVIREREKDFIRIT